MIPAVLGAGLAILALACPLVLRRIVPDTSRRLTAAVLGGGVVAGTLAALAERAAGEATGLRLAGGGTGSLVFALLLVAPLSEGLKVLVIWPLYVWRRLGGARAGFHYAACAGAGFAAARAVAAALDADAWEVARAAAALPAQVLLAGGWGWALALRRSRGRWFATAWLASTVSHAVYVHALRLPWPGPIATAGPLLATLVALAWLALREGSARSRVSGRPSVFQALRDPPSLATLRDALVKRDRALLPHWIGVGALVTVGVAIASLAAVVWAAREAGVDFSVADESAANATGPVALLVGGALAAFPISGYLVARASDAPGVTEPALGAALAILLVVGVLAVTAPLAVVFALALAPIAFALACGGAWLGVRR
ncbi:MAG: protease PrsW [Polyangiaceae bacterium]|nr:protease PrsW [Polyangiaceae bacterium]